jgi:hypothetical protein
LPCLAYDDHVAIGNDITGRVRALLPPQLVDKTAEVDASLGHGVTFRVVDALYGGARGAANLEDGVVWLPQRSINNLSVIGEELMHLHRYVVGGFPKAQALQHAVDAGYASALHQLAGHFDEAAFFPFLEGIGLAPRDEIGDAMPLTARLLRRELPAIVTDGPTEYWRATLPVMYVQAHLMAQQNAPGRDAVLGLYAGGDLRQYADLGALLENEIIAAQHENPRSVRQRFEICFYNHLNLSRNAVRAVRRNGNQ